MLLMISLQQRWCSFMVDGVRGRFELVDDMEVRDKCWNEDVDGVDGVVWRELENDDVLLTDL